MEVSKHSDLEANRVSVHVMGSNLDVILNVPIALHLATHSVDREHTFCIKLAVCTRGLSRAIDLLHVGGIDVGSLTRKITCSQIHTRLIDAFIWSLYGVYKRYDTPRVLDK